MIGPAQTVTAVEAIGSLVLAFAAALGLALLLTPLVREQARRHGWVDHPDGRRKLHVVAVPRPGGLALYAAFAVSFLASVTLLPPAVWGGASNIDAGVHMLVASAIVLSVGLLDDIRGAGPVAKIAAQTLAGLYLYANGFKVEVLWNPLGDGITLGWLSLPVSVLWLVGLSNAFNLIDGLDGLATGVGLFAAFVVVAMALSNERWEIAVLAVGLAGALLGFLRYNYSPASIFLGDSGALFIGFALATLSLRGSMKRTAAIAVITPLLALGLPILDTAITLLRRLVRGTGVLKADADHIHHRVVRLGLTPQRAVILLYGVTALFAAMALLSLSGQAQHVGLAVAVSSIVTWLGVRRLGYGELGTITLRVRRGFFGGNRPEPDTPAAADRDDLDGAA